MSYRQTYVVQFGDMNEDVRKGRELAVAVEAFDAGEFPRKRIIELAMEMLRS